MTYQYMPKLFHDPCKSPPLPPSPKYLMYGPSSKLSLNELTIFATLQLDSFHRKDKNQITCASFELVITVQNF